MPTTSRPGGSPGHEPIPADRNDLAWQAVYTSYRDGFGAVLALDGAGAANSYVPTRGDVMVGLPAGIDRSFPASTVLDRVAGTERVVILWYRLAHRVAPLLGELRATGGVIAPADCHVRRVELDKREAVPLLGEQHPEPTAP